MRQGWLMIIVLACAIAGKGFAAGLAEGGGTNSSPAIRWDANRRQLAAELTAWPLPRIAERLATVTGWRVFYEPATRISVTTRFRDLPVGEGLRRLFGDLNFALIPRTNGPTHLYVYVRDRAAATIEVRARSAETASKKHLVDNELIITLPPGSKRSIEELARELGARVVGRIDSLNAYRLRFDDAESAAEARRRLEDDPDIVAVDSNYFVPRPDRLPQPGSSGGPALNLKPEYTPNGEYPVIALIDTAVSGEGSPVKDFLLPALSTTGEPAPAGQALTHGTAMAETILAALAQGASAETTPWRILPVDVYGGNPNTTTYQVAEGILMAAAASGPTLFNLSLGSEAESPFLHRVIQELQRQGAGFIAAAGNEPVAIPTFPAAYPEVLAVTAGDGRGGVAPYANYGAFIDVVAPGSQLIHYNGMAYIGTGTSYSASKVSGLVAAYLSRNPGSTFSQAVTELSRQLPAVQPPSNAAGGP